MHPKRLPLGGLCAALFLSGCATPRYHLTQKAFDQGIESCLASQEYPGLEKSIEVTVSDNQQWAVISCVWR